MPPPKLPIGPKDSPRVEAIKAGLNNYFAAVALQDVSCDEKLQAIADTFSAENAELITNNRTFVGREEIVQQFYASPHSPVMKDPKFCPAANLPTVCIAEDENTIAVEIALTKDLKVGDWFTFDAEAKIKRMRIYS